MKLISCSSVTLRTNCIIVKLCNMSFSLNYLSDHENYKTSKYEDDKVAKPASSEIFLTLGWICSRLITIYQERLYGDIS